MSDSDFHGPATTDTLRSGTQRANGWLLASALCSSLLGCEKTPPPKTPAPVPVASGQTLDHFMAARYGQPTAAAWTDSAGALHRPCARHQDSSASGSALFLAVCGEVPDAGHATSGIVDLFVLDGSWDNFRVVADTNGLESGSNGNPGEVSILHLGQHRFGFQLIGNFLGQGDFEETTQWFAATPHGIANLLSLTSLADTRATGGCLDDSLLCTLEARRAEIDSSQRLAPRFPILLADSLTVGTTLRTRQTLLPWDSSTWSYAIPPALSEASAKD